MLSTPIVIACLPSGIRSARGFMSAVNSTHWSVVRIELSLLGRLPPGR